MYKLSFIVAFVLSGCSYFTFNTTMCEQIASDPNVIMPKKCQNYDKKKADKAFNKVVNKKKISDEDIEFHRDDEE